jgi:hypothetical protein
MKKIKTTAIKLILSVTILFCITNAVHAQMMMDIRNSANTDGPANGGVIIDAYAKNLPSEQKVSLRAPATIKVDGKAIEWDNKFQAYNHHTDFYYTIANDDDKLYLIIHATDPGIIRRIINGGITLTINKSGKKNDKEGISITYPVFEKGNRFNPMLKFTNPMITGRTMPVMNPDSLALVNNKGMGDKAKLIRTAGMKDIDTLISVYNADGIKAVGMFDNKQTYAYELSITLKNLGLDVNNPIKFAYQLMINEVAAQGITFTNDASGNVTSISITKGPNTAMGQAATDFWGEYTLAK